jgi:curved DNA-binding protein CbpA
MFVDYYGVLEINLSSTLDQIRSAFKKQALKWHPDRNLGQDTTLRMQQINEAYLILKDPEARELYDIEYHKFKQYQQGYNDNETQRNRSQGENDKEKYQNEKQYEYKEYTVNDDILGRWMENARKQAVDLAKKTIEDIKGISAAGAKAVANETLTGIGRYIIFTIIILVIIGLIKTCNV